MNPKCIQAIIQAAGRQLSKAELDGIESRLAKHMRGLSKTDPAFRSMSLQERLNAAAERAALELIGESQLKEKRLALTVMAQARIAQHLGEQAARGIDGLDAIDRMVASHADFKSNFLSVEAQSNAVRDDALRQMIGTLTAGNPKWFGLFQNKEGIRAVVQEIFGEKSGNADAAAGAKQWAEVTTWLRDRFNRNGGDVGELDDWGLPHHHSQIRVASAGREEWLKSLPAKEQALSRVSGRHPPALLARDKWVGDITPLLDREHYINPDGTRMTDPQLHEFLQNAWTTIATGGANKVEAGTFKGNGSRANRGNASREIHFKDADSYIKYQESYGEKSLYDVLIHHIDSVAKDVALVETFGPNPDHVMRFFRDKEAAKAKLATPSKTGKITGRVTKSENLYNVVAGKTQPVASEWLANAFDTLRNWLVASRLGSSVITSLSDEATLYMTAHLNNLPESQLFKNELSTYNPANRVEERMAQRAGLGLRTLVSSLNRFGQESLGAGFSKVLANATLRASGLMAMTEARRRAFGVTMMGGIGGVVKDHAALKDIDAHDNRVLLSKGINDTDFQVWKKAQQEDWGNGNDTMLTPESIYRIPDADIDAVIAPEQAKTRAAAQKQIDKLNDRNAQDQKWLQQRAANLSAWLAKKQADITARLAKSDTKIDDGARASVEKIKDRLSQLQEEMDHAEGYWMKPDGDMPGIDSNQSIAFYGKRTLRSTGKDEGRAQRSMEYLESKANAVLADAEALKISLKKTALEDLFDGFTERRTEFREFQDRAKDRAARRTLVQDRIAKNIDPALDAARQHAREQAATKLLAAILEETDIAVIEPGAKERVITGAAMQRGTLKGELVRSMFLFKSFPLAMIARHFVRGMSQQTAGGKAAYIATLIASTTVAGALSLEINELLSGRDPRNLNPTAKGGTRNWIQAMLKGGSLGIYGDFLFSDATQHGQSPVASFMGPVVGLGEDVFNLTQGNALQSFQGKDTHASAEVVKFVKSNTPAANLWYAKAALDHMIFHQLQQYFSPGYLQRMQNRAEKDFGQKYWWRPGELAPDRAPDLAATAGQ